VVALISASTFCESNSAKTWPAASAYCRYVMSVMLMFITTSQNCVAYVDHTCTANCTFSYWELSAACVPNLMRSGEDWRRQKVPGISCLSFHFRIKQFQLTISALFIRFLLAVSKGPNRVGAFLPLPQAGNRPSFRNVVCSSYLEFRPTLSVMHHRQNHLFST
jgi:hypothetical protein